jgi:hypothetical protein
VKDGNNLFEYKRRAPILIFLDFPPPVTRFLIKVLKDEEIKL